MSEFYAIDSTRFSLREYWWGSKSPLVIIGWIIKWLHIRMPGSSDDPNTFSTLPFRVNALPPEVIEMFKPLTAQFLELGFQEPVFHKIEDSVTRTNIYWATFRHSSSRYFARIHHRVWHQAQKPNRGLFPMFFTEFTDGTFFVSTAGKPDMTTPSTVHMNRIYRATAAALWTAHEQMVNSRFAQKNIVTALTGEDLMQATERHHVLMRDFHLGRRVFRALTADEKVKAESFASSVDQARASGWENAEVLAELDRLQQQKGRWQTMLWVLIGSLAAFIAVGAAQWKWKTTLWLVPVLLLHEAGHWVAMRVFGYRNLRMFFIPLFGAAVVGRHWNVPGWKKTLVSLAGPVPGIALGLFLGVASLVYHRQWMNDFALMLLAVNGLNLFPLLPFDGGHVLQATLFCRNRWLDTTFRIVTILCLLGLGLLGVGQYFFYIAIAMGVALPISFRLAKIAEELRLAPLPQPLPGEDRIPQPTANAIITAIRASFPPKLAGNNKTVAQHTLNVFETLNAKPPGVLATLGLLAVHGGAFVAALIIAVLLILGRSANLRELAKAATRQPQHRLECGSIQHWFGVGAKPSVRNVLVTTFKNRPQALKAFSNLTNRAPASSSVTLCGDSVLLTLPAEDDKTRDQWFDDLQARSTNTFVASSNAPVMLTMTFLAPTDQAATNLTRELRDYFRLGNGMHLVPPWSPEAIAPSFAPYRRARDDWNKIELGSGEHWNDPSLKEYDLKMHTARKRGAMGEFDALVKERTEKVRELKTQALEKMRARASSGMAELLDLREKLDALSFTNRVERKQLFRQVAVKLGEVAYEGNNPKPEADSLGTGTGTVSHHGLLLELEWVNFNDATIGFPAFVDWLCAQHCVQIRYTFIGSGWHSDLYEEDALE